MSAPFLKETADGVQIRVKAHPRSSKNEIAGVLNDELKVKVTAPPVDSAANVMLIKFLAGRLGCPKNAITLIHGQTSQHKIFHITGMSREDIESKLAI